MRRSRQKHRIIRPWGKGSNSRKHPLWRIIRPLVRRLLIPQVGSSGCTRDSSTAFCTLVRISPMVLFLRRIIRLLWSDCPTVGCRIIRTYSIFCFILAYVQLVAAVIWTSRDVSAFSLQLDISTVVWTPRRWIWHLRRWIGRLDGALDVSTVHWTFWRCIRRPGYDLDSIQGT